MSPVVDANPRGETMLGMKPTGSSRSQRISGMIPKQQQDHLTAGRITHRVGIVDLHVRAGFLALAPIWSIGVIVHLMLWAITLDRTNHPPPPVSAERKAAHLLIHLKLSEEPQ